MTNNILPKKDQSLIRRFLSLKNNKVSIAEVKEAVLSSSNSRPVELIKDTLAFLGQRISEPNINLNQISESDTPFIIVSENGAINIIEDMDSAFIVVSSAEHGLHKKLSRETFKENIRGTIIFAERNLEQKSDTRSRLRLLNLFSLLGIGNFLWIALATGMSNVLSLASSLFIMVVYDRIIPNQAASSLYALSAGVGLAIFFDFLLKEARQSILSRVTNATDNRLNSEIYEQFVETINDMRSQSVGALSNTMRDYENYKDFIQNVTLLAFIDIPFVLIFVWVISLIGGPLAIIPLLCIPIVLGSVALVQPVMFNLSKNVSKVTQSRQSQLLETLNGLDNIRVSNVYALMRRRFLMSANEFSTVSGKFKRISMINTTIITLAQQAAQVLIIIYGFLLFVEQEITIGAIIATVILTGKTLGPLSKVAQTLGRANTAYSAYLNLKTFFTQPRLERKTGLKSMITSASKVVEASNITLRLTPNAPPLFSGLNISINPGEKVAIIGRTGAGKTTLLRLLSGLLRPEIGNVMLAGQDIRSFSRADIAERLGVAFQDSWIFSGSVKENITLGDDNFDNEQIIEAIKWGGGANSIGQAPEALDTIINDGGTNLSGGQKQSICLARTLLRDPTLFLLDEPTSAMDMECEQAFLASFTGRLRDKAMVIVTHKPAIVSACQRVVVIQQGKIAWDGSLEEYRAMLAQKGQN